MNHWWSRNEAQKGPFGDTYTYFPKIDPQKMPKEGVQLILISVVKPLVTEAFLAYYLDMWSFSWGDKNK